MQIIKHSLQIILLALLVFPAFSFRILDYYSYDVPPLKGYIVDAEEPVFTWNKWLDGSFQHKYDKYLKDNIGLRNYIIKAYNQLDFTLFKKSHAYGVIVGKDNYLYELNYIYAYTGADFIGEDSINEKCEKLKMIQDELKKINIELFVVLAPGKASCCAEFIPDKYLKNAKEKTNNKYFARCFDRTGVNYIDFNTYFMTLKESSEYALFPKCGIHWSAYGSWIALDSIINYIEDATGSDLVDISYSGIEESETPRLTDYDIAEGMNLMDSIPCDPMPYPYGQKMNVNGKVKPRLMVIADSYYWSIYNKYYNRFLWDEQEFRYYNQQVFSPGKDHYITHDLSIDTIKKYDVIMLLYTEANMRKFANNFIDQAYSSLIYESRLEKIRERIMKTPEWIEDIRIKAIEKGVSLEAMINLDAKWILDQELAKESSKSEKKENNGI